MLLMMTQEVQKKTEKNNLEAQQGVIDHLEELRKRIILIAAGWIILSFLSYFFYESILHYLILPLQKYQEKPVFTRPTEPFIAAVKLSAFTGGFLNIPNVLYQVWAFAAPALVTPREKRAFALIIWGFPLFFAAGALFAFYIIIPFGMRILFSFGKEVMIPLISIGSYLNFILLFMLVLGILFNLPVVSGGLASAGIISPAMLRSKRRYAIVLSFILAAILTPPDVVTQIFVAVPLIFLYEISILFSSFFKN